MHATDTPRPDALAGWRIVVTRPEHQAAELCERLAALGAEPIPFPVIAIAPPEPGAALDRAIARLNDYQWVIFTSVNGVACFWERYRAIACGRRGVAADERQARWIRSFSRFGGRRQKPADPERRLRTASRPERRAAIFRTDTPAADAPGLPPGCRVAAIGRATAAALQRRDVRVDLTPGEYRAEAILDAIGDVAGLRILLPRADIARPDLALGLAARGAAVDEVVAYRTIPAIPSQTAFESLRAGVDVITFTSSSTVRNFVALTAGMDYGDPLIACIGPVTATAARDLGLDVDVTAEEYTIEGLVQALRLQPQPLRDHHLQHVEHIVRDQGRPNAVRRQEEQ
ncbi:MAG: uroporphyrinogen-III synthase [Chloroflexi bacterium]|nr:uroporphyrinogen-III synthase [Chloroflexota bacterium]